MESSNSKNKNNVEGDRLSNFPDDLIHNILSYVDIEQAIEISCLSSRWLYIWTTMPSLNFSDVDFHTSTEFSNFVTHVLSRRNNEIEVSSAILTFCGRGSRSIVERIFNYAFSHKVQLLRVTYLSGKEIVLPLSFFRSPSLKHLTLIGDTIKSPITGLCSWELQNLTTLKLRCVTLYVDDTNKCDGLFSSCSNLKNLTLKDCRLAGSNGFDICHPGLSSLTLKDCCHDINVITPQLKSLAVYNCRRIQLITTPNLFSLRYIEGPRNYYNSYYENDDDDDDDTNDVFLKVSTKLRQLENVDICVNRLFKKKAYTRKIVCLLRQLHSVKRLTLNLELLEVLSSSLELSHPFPYFNLKNLKIYPANVSKPEVTISTKVKNYLLNVSSGMTLTMVSHEEIITAKKVTLAQKLMKKLHALLNEWKKNSERNTARMKQDMTTVHEQMVVENYYIKWHFWEKMTHIVSYWRDLHDHFVRGYSRTIDIILMLPEIKEVLTKLPASHRDKLNARFSSLCGEAETLMDNLMYQVKIQCDKNPNRSNVFFHELATSSRTSY